MDLQHTLRSLLRGIPRLAIGGVPAERAGENRLACERLNARDCELLLEADFSFGDPIPVEHSADSVGLPVPLGWRNVPKGTQSMVLLVEDPDAPTPNPFLHWAVYDISPKAKDIGEALTLRAQVGRNSMMRPSWAPCAPPKGDTPHRYVFQLFALKRPLGIGPHCGRTAIVEAMRGAVIGVGLLIGTYRR
jgi:Raf kinase inhibitor-like YbhB/YbcL family protein